MSTRVTTHLRRLIGVTLSLCFASAAQAQTAGTSYLATNGYLGNEQYLSSPGHKYFGIMQGDGNFCVYQGTGPGDNRGGVWCSGSGGRTGQFHAVMQSDGNFCVYQGSTPPQPNHVGLWCNYSNGGSAPYVLSLDDNGLLQVLNGSSPQANTGSRWAEPKYTITIAQPAAGGGIDSYNGFCYHCGVVNDGIGTRCSSTQPRGTVIPATAHSAAGWGFDGWSGGGGCGAAGTCQLTFMSNQSLSVSFSKVNLSANPSPGGAVQGALLNCGSGATTCAVPAPRNSTAVLTAVPQLGYVFDSWVGPCQGQGNPCSLLMNEDKLNVTAGFRNPGTSTVTLQPPANGQIGGSGLQCGAGGLCTKVFTNGTQVQLLAGWPASGMGFASWGAGPCAGQGETCTFTVNGNTTFSAVFEQVGFATVTIAPNNPAFGYLVSYNAYVYSCGNNNGSIVSKCASTQTKGTTIPVTAVAAPGHRFVGWTGNGCWGTATCSVPFDTTKTMTANFE